MNNYLNVWIIPALCLFCSSASDVKAAPADGKEKLMTEEAAREEYAYTIGKLAYIWGWPVVNVHNRRASLKMVLEPGLNGGVIPVAPVNYFCMLTDYLKPLQRSIVTPNQDTVYGVCFTDLSIEPVLIQVPDFGNRYWVLQCMDAYTDVFSSPGTVHKSGSGIYMLVGPNWEDTTPEGVIEVIRAPTDLVWCLLRVFMNDTDEDRAALQPLINQVEGYPLSQYDGTLKTKDWSKIPSFPVEGAAAGEIHWVRDEFFWDDLAKVLAENAPRPGEEAMVENFRRLIEKRDRDPAVKAGLERAVHAGSRLVSAGFPYSNQEDKFGSGWAGNLTGGAFGSHYLNRAWIAKAYIAVNKVEDAFYLGTNVDGAGQLLNGGKDRYTITFPKDGLPPCRAFWSLTLYDQEHFFADNLLQRYSLGTKNLQQMKFSPDGSLTIHIQNSSPGKDKESNWLPAPKAPFSLLIRFYVPEKSVIDKQYAPPPVERVE
ncbi:MAG: DUF1254 domain-containing protein [PVC group bacterium]